MRVLNGVRSEWRSATWEEVSKHPSYDGVLILVTTQLTTSNRVFWTHQNGAQSFAPPLYTQASSSCTRYWFSSSDPSVTMNGLSEETQPPAGRHTGRGSTLCTRAKMRRKKKKELWKNVPPFNLQPRTTELFEVSIHVSKEIYGHLWLTALNSCLHIPAFI